MDVWLAFFGLFFVATLVALVFYKYLIGELKTFFPGGVLEGRFAIILEWWQGFGTSSVRPKESLQGHSGCESCR